MNFLNSIGVFLFTASVSAAAHVCQWPADPVVVTNTATQQKKVWTIANSPVLFSKVTSTHPAFLSYQNWVKANTTTDPIELLKRQRKFFSSNDMTESVDTRKMDLVMAGQIGEIHPITCLESLLLVEHTAKFPLEKTPNEFVAAILQKGSLLKIYFLSDKIEEGSAPKAEVTNQEIQKDLKLGYTYLINLHNHPFMLSNPTGDIGGTTLPSGDSDYGDVYVFNNLVVAFQLKNAWITNGFNSVRLNQKDIDSLNQLK